VLQHCAALLFSSGAPRCGVHPASSPSRTHEIRCTQRFRTAARLYSGFGIGREDACMVSVSRQQLH
jgi:hypothetical protein